MRGVIHPSFPLRGRWDDQHSSLSKPLPPRSQTCESRLSECVHVFLIVHAAGQSSFRIPLGDCLIFVNDPAQHLALSFAFKRQKSCFGRARSRLGNHSFPFTKILTHLIWDPSQRLLSSRMTTCHMSQFRSNGKFPGSAAIELPLSRFLHQRAIDLTTK